jgi:anti-sigma regulatory factor (Ser/Thr protein kinase)
MYLQIKNELTEIERLAEEIESFGELHDIPADVVFGINLSLDELITNTINYGYADSQQHFIQVELDLTAEDVVIQLKDDGLPFDPLQRPDPDINQSLDDKPIGGLGIYLVRKMMDEVEYRRIDNFNILKMKKKIKSKD